MILGLEKRDDTGSWDNDVRMEATNMAIRPEKISAVSGEGFNVARLLWWAAVCHTR